MYGLVGADVPVEGLEGMECVWRLDEMLDLVLSVSWEIRWVQ